MPWAEQLARGAPALGSPCSARRQVGALPSCRAGEDGADRPGAGPSHFPCWATPGSAPPCPAQSESGVSGESEFRAVAKGGKEEARTTAWGLEQRLLCVPPPREQLERGKHRLGNQRRDHRDHAARTLPGRQEGGPSPTQTAAHGAGHREATFQGRQAPQVSDCQRAPPTAFWPSRHSASLLRGGPLPPSPSHALRHFSLDYLSQQVSAVTILKGRSLRTRRAGPTRLLSKLDSPC